jgi:hypothetical protein
VRGASGGGFDNGLFRVIREHKDPELRSTRIPSCERSTGRWPWRSRGSRGWSSPAGRDTPSTSASRRLSPRWSTRSRRARRRSPHRLPASRNR